MARARAARAQRACGFYPCRTPDRGVRVGSRHKQLVEWKPWVCAAPAGPLARGDSFKRTRESPARAGRSDGSKNGPQGIR